MLWEWEELSLCLAGGEKLTSRCDAPMRRKKTRDEEKLKAPLPGWEIIFVCSHGWHSRLNPTKNVPTKTRWVYKISCAKNVIVYTNLNFNRVFRNFTIRPSIMNDLFAKLPSRRAFASALGTWPITKSKDGRVLEFKWDFNKRPRLLFICASFLLFSQRPETN